MARSALWAAPAIRSLLAAAFVFHLASRWTDAGESPQQPSKRAEAVVAADRTQSLTLAFSLDKDCRGEVWAYFDISNRGRNGVLVCEQMTLSFSVLTRPGNVDVPLNQADGTRSPILFVLVDAPPPARAMSGLTGLSRRVQVPAVWFPSLIGIRELIQKKNADVVGTVEGSILTWKEEAKEYIRVPFTISSKAQSWDKYCDLFSARVPAKRQQETEEATKGGEARAGTRGGRRGSGDTP